MYARHPRFTLGIGFLVLCTFLLLADQSPIPHLKAAPPIHCENDGASLKSRLEASESIYQKMLTDRKGLIRKYGPKPSDIHMFPPSVAPYPPYTVWDYFPAAFNCPWETERLGALGDGGKWVCGISRLATKRDCVVYSVGINYESSFEAEILDRTSSCQIWGYDFSVKSFGPEIAKTDKYRTHFFPYALGGEDSYDTSKDVHTYSLRSLMEQNGHSFIDILKVDVESHEFASLTAFIKSFKQEGKPLPFGQLQLEIHAWHKSFEQYLSWWESLEEMGLRPFWTEPNLVYQNYNRGGSADLAEYSFINIHGTHDLISIPQASTS